jgi:hypothetical protein
MPHESLVSQEILIHHCTSGDLYVTHIKYILIYLPQQVYFLLRSQRVDRRRRPREHQLYLQNLGI